jgi:UDP-N-acetylmuramoyl-tripeptide--D-alanyl-D-alanine ligase
MVLGDMGELGEDAEELHRALGTTLREQGIDRLFAVGELSQATVAAFGDAGQWFASVDELVDAVGAQMSATVNVLVKGSRSARMERAVAGLRAQEPARMEA